MSSARVNPPAASPSVPRSRPWFPDLHISIRLRLTVLYTAILTLALLAFGAALYATVQSAVLQTARTALRAEARSLDPGHLLSLSRNGVPGAPGDADNGIVPPGTYIQIRNSSGSVVRKASGLTATLPLSAATLTALTEEGAREVGPEVVSIGSQPMLLYSYITPSPIGDPGGHGSGRAAPSGSAPGQTAGGPRAPGPGPGPLILQAAQSLAGPYGILDTLRATLGIGACIVVLLAFGAGWLLAGTALRPIARMTRVVQAIGDTRDFSQRVAHNGPRDEVGRLAVTFNTMLSNLQEAYQTQRRFVADASHELRTPLTSILGNLDLLQREPPISAEDRRAVVGDLVRAGTRLSRLVGDLLTLARTNSGRSLRNDVVPLVPLLTHLGRQLAASYPERAIGLDEVHPVAVVGDPDAVTQVLLILLDNALKFSAPQGRVWVRAQSSGKQVTIAVGDSGPGIDPSALPHIFERFYRGDRMRSTAGNGLGLAIAQALMESMHGEIGVESSPGQGSVFTLHLPQAAAERNRVA